MLRLLQVGEPHLEVTDFRTIFDHPLHGAVAREGLEYLADLFGKPHATGCGLLRSEYPEQGETFAAQVHVLASDLIRELGEP